MNLIALILGLALERMQTRLLDLRENTWFTGWFDLGARWMRGAPGSVGFVLGALVMLLPAVPVAWVAWAFHDVLAGLPYIAFAMLMLVLSLGPQDLLAQSEEWLEARARGDEAAAAAIERAICQGDSEATERATARKLEAAILVQANHALFGVIFWFMVLGPAGAWAYRVADLFRRHVRATGSGGPNTARAELLFGIVAWIPARLLAASYAVAGSFDDAFEDWRAYYQRTSAGFFRVSENILASAGIGAIRRRSPEAGSAAAVEATRDLVRRALFIWLTAIAALTLVGWAT
jgi:membrane protein required for beta-lactamase induction